MVMRLELDSKEAANGWWRLVKGWMASIVLVARKFDAP